MNQPIQENTEPTIDVETLANIELFKQLESAFKIKRCNGKQEPESIKSLTALALYSCPENFCIKLKGHILNTKDIIDCLQRGNLLLSNKKGSPWLKYIGTMPIQQRVMAQFNESRMY